MDTLQAAILLEKFKYFEVTVEKRNRCAAYYTETLEPLVEKGFIQTPRVMDGNRSAWAQYSIIINDKSTRDSLVEYMKLSHVNVAIFYPTPLHTQKCFENLGYKLGDLPVTEATCDTIFNLPCYAEITQEEQDYIVNLVYKFYLLK